MSCLKRILVMLLLSLSFISTTIAAETLPSQVNLERGQDSADGRDYFIDTDIDLSGPRLTLGYGESDATSGSTALNTTTRLVGISSNPLDDTSIGLNYSDWGQSGEINIKTYRLDLTVNLENWSFILAPQTRRIELHTLAARRPILDIDSNGINAGFNFYGAAPLYLGVMYSRHDYSRDVAALSTYPILALLFSPASLQHAYGFERERLAGNVGVFFDWGSIGIDGTRSVSAVDSSVSTSIAASVQYKFNPHWSMRVRGGNSDNSLSTATTTFASISIGYQF